MPRRRCPHQRACGSDRFESGEHGQAGRQGGGDHRCDKRYGIGRREAVRRRGSICLHHRSAPRGAGSGCRGDRPQRDGRAGRCRRPRGSGPAVRDRRTRKRKRRRVVHECWDRTDRPTRCDHRGTVRRDLPGQQPRDAFRGAEGVAALQRRRFDHHDRLERVDQRLARMERLRGEQGRAARVRPRLARQNSRTDGSVSTS